MSSKKLCALPLFRCRPQCLPSLVQLLDDLLLPPSQLCQLLVIVDFCHLIGCKACWSIATAYQLAYEIDQVPLWLASKDDLLKVCFNKVVYVELDIR